MPKKSFLTNPDKRATNNNKTSPKISSCSLLPESKFLQDCPVAVVTSASVGPELSVVRPVLLLQATITTLTDHQSVISFLSSFRTVTWIGGMGLNVGGMALKELELRLLRVCLISLPCWIIWTSETGTVVDQHHKMYLKSYSLECIEWYRPLYKSDILAITRNRTHQLLNTLSSWQKPFRPNL